jgi:hypothetical protein
MPMTTTISATGRSCRAMTSREARSGRRPFREGPCTGLFVASSPR